MPKTGKMPGTRGPQRPRCSVGHDASKIMRVKEGWVCSECFNEHQAKRDVGGVILPAGVNVTPDRFSELFPNRAARRR